MSGRERSVKVNAYHTNLFASCVKEVNCFLNGVANRTHSNDYTLSVLCAVVIKELIICTDFLVYLLHICFGSGNSVVVILVTSLSVLEENIGVLGRTAKNRSFRIQCSCSEICNILHIKHILKVCIVPNLNLLYLVRSAEAVEEVKERNTALQGCKVSNCAEVHNLLNICRTKHSVACLTASHNVGMIAENIKRMSRYATSRNVNYARNKLAGDFVHIRNHKEQAL